jgi:hypothetical protein
VVFNLLDYAVRFTASKSITLSAAVQSDSADDVLVRMALTETGVEIPSAKQPLIFEPLRNGEAAAALKAGATGVGLATARRLVELMGGTIELPGQSDAGSTFAFTARFQKQKAAEKLDAAVHHAESVRLKELSILVAEHNAVNRDVVAKSSADVAKDIGHPETSISTPLPDLKGSAIECPKHAFTHEHIEEKITSSTEIAGSSTNADASTPAASAEGEFALETIPGSPAELAPDTTGQSYLLPAHAISSPESLPIKTPGLDSSPYLLPKMAEPEPNVFSCAISPVDAQIDVAHNIAIEAAEKLVLVDSKENVPGKASQSAEPIGIFPPEPIGMLTAEGAPDGKSDDNGVAANAQLSAPAIDAQIDVAHTIAVDAANKLLVVNSDKHLSREADQAPESIGIFIAEEDSCANADHSGPAANAQLSAPAGLALLQSTCEMTQQSPSLAKQDDGPTPRAAWNPFEQARKSLSKSRFDVRVIHNDGDPSDRNLI